MCASSECYENWYESEVKFPSPTGKGRAKVSLNALLNPVVKPFWTWVVVGTTGGKSIKEFLFRKRVLTPCWGIFLYVYRDQSLSD